MTDLSHPLRSDAAQAPRSAATRSDRLWTLAGVIVAALTLLPVLSLALLAAQPTGDVWTHLVGTVLPRSLWTTFLLMAGVGALTLTLGVGTAWLVTMCRFPGRAFFDWALLVPLAVPTYIIAYTYVEILDYTGPVQSVIPPPSVMYRMGGYPTSRHALVNFRGWASGTLFCGEKPTPL